MGNSDGSKRCRMRRYLPQLLVGHTLVHERSLPPPPPNRVGRGEPIPRIEYLPEEVATWGLVLGQLEALFPQHACTEVGWVTPGCHAACWTAVQGTRVCGALWPPCCCFRLQRIAALPPGPAQPLLHACNRLAFLPFSLQFLHSLPLFGFRQDEVPQLDELSNVLLSHTGFRIRPVAGLVRGQPTRGSSLPAD